MIKFGIVDYVNSIHLSHGLEKHCEVMKRTPAKLAEMFLSGKLDVGFMPSVEYLRHPNCGELVRGVSISSFGATNSVFLISKTRIERIESLVLSSESKTSNFITMELLKRRYGVEPSVLLDQRAIPDARVVIGDKALREKNANVAARMDIGNEWMSFTGLPMVFAVCVAKSARLAEWATDLLGRIVVENSRNLENVLAAHGAKEHLRYVQGLNYDLSDAHMRSLELISGMLKPAELNFNTIPFKNNDAKSGAQLCFAQ